MNELFRSGFTLQFDFLCGASVKSIRLLLFAVYHYMSLPNWLLSVHQLLYLGTLLFCFSYVFVSDYSFITTTCTLDDGQLGRDIL
jgi:hypothetical protein